MTLKIVPDAARLGLKVTRTAFSLSIKLTGLAVSGAVHVVRARNAPASPPSGQPGPTDSAASNGAQTIPAEPAAPAESTAPAEPAAPTASAPPATPAPPAPVDLSPAPEIPADLVPPEQQPDTPLTPEQDHAKTVDDRDEIVAEFAEDGAQDGAGAQLHLPEPWEGYDTETADTISARIRDADAATVAVVELYEQSGEGRTTVLEAAERRLAELSGPDVTS